MVHIPERNATKRNCSIPPGLPIEMHFVRDVAMDPSYGSSSGDVGNRYGNKPGANVATSHEMMLARAANKMSGSWPRMVRFLVSLLFAIVVGGKKSANSGFVTEGLSGGPLSSSPSSAETISLWKIRT